MRLSELRGFRHMATREFFGKPLEYNPNNHRYKWGGEYVPSVTTLIGQLDKPGLTAWAGRMATEELENRYHANNGRLEAEDFNAGRDAHKTRKQLAADDGTDVHDYVTKVLHKEAPPLPRNELVAAACRAADKWLVEHKVEPIEMERQVYSAMYGYAGTLDFFGKVDGLLGIADFKSTKGGIYKEAWIQCAGYDMPLTEELKLGPLAHFAIHLSKYTGEFKAEMRGNNHPKRAHAREAFLQLLRLYPSLKALDRKD